MNFDDFTQKVTEKVKKLGKDTAEEVQKLNKIRQLNGKANDAKKQIESTYSEIGKKFYEMNREYVPEGFEELIRSINEKKAEIEQLQEQVREVKGVVLCPGCGVEVSGDERFCPNCGSRMPEKVETAAEEDEEQAETDAAGEGEAPAETDAVGEGEAPADADMAEDAGKKAADVAEDVADAAADALKTAGDMAAAAAEDLKDAASGLADEAKEVAQEIAEGAKKVAGNAFEEIKEAAEDLKEEVEKKL